MNQGHAWKKFIHYIKTQQKQGITIRELASNLGMTERQVYNWLRSPRPMLPSPVTRTKIHHLTQGDITMRSWLVPVEPRTDTNDLE